ncbi:hypothetical protein FVEN_g13053 [Fusarium venenatum]|uniref:Uncharacterized protein n=1 Tax=Fusarium venenatum TaxID=56646 RepID=A0A2L2U4L7_9HYPO|nr:uncharacterized protein FVRRES_10182 [Fusarium venenatum]KAG8350534.1 hypothetical protein FVEN_g13053 [Fusarium venenatum]CEI70105.1 unnamed protein product [Fusarium venenatum]
MTHNSTETVNHIPFTRDAAAGFMLGGLGGIIAFSFSYILVCFGLSSLRARRQRRREQRQLMELIHMMDLSES